MEAIGEIEKVLDNNSVKNMKDKGFSLNTDISELTNVTFLVLLEAMQTVLNKQVKELKASIEK